MADAETVEAKLEALQSEFLSRVEELRQEVQELRQPAQLPLHAGSGRRTREERLAGVERLRAFHERVLRRRGGEPLPSSAEEIARMRDERTAQILGE